MEVDLWAGILGLAVEIDGYYHFQSRDSFRRNRRKDLALQKLGISWCASSPRTWSSGWKKCWT